MKGKERYKIDTWYEAPSRKSNKPKDVLGLKKEGYVVMKFFVSNLPGGCASYDLQDVLKRFGKIHGICIARKFDRLGKRFGFVSFFNVKDPLSLEKELKDVWIGSYKLFIVLARFVDGERVNWKEEKHWVPVAEIKSVENNVETAHVGVDNSGSSMATGRSFKETLVGKDVGKSVEEIVIDDGLIGNTHWNGLGLIGTTKGMKELTGLKDWLMSVRLANVGIRYVGGLSVVLVFEEKECMAEFFSTKEVWNQVLDSLGIWEGQRLQVGRIAWLKCFGVPLCLFDTRVMAV
ncbi:putative RNA recognition motif domain, nucleotide-binding alpha-beta plait domain superfamily [Helianthus annuus]|nr:putative RNA recognition motif domain, nucleotide-binding alpha-beta plait domain superfamily [Helianthus annuus]